MTAHQLGSILVIGGGTLLIFVGLGFAWLAWRERHGDE